MKVPSSVLSLLLAMTSASLCPGDDSGTPPVAYTLEIDGQSVTLSPDKPTKIEGQFNNPTVTLRVANTRTLNAAGITFSYPAYFTFDGDTSDPDVQTWTVEGKNVTLMLFSFSEPVDPRALAESTSEALEAKGLNLEDARLKLGGEDRSGIKATMNLGTSTLIQQVFALPPTAKGSRLLVIQEVRSEGEADSAELGAAMKLVASSLKFTD